MKKAMKFTALVMALMMVLCAFAACKKEKSQSELLVGKWVDNSSVKSGYEFMPDGKTVKITFVDVGLSYNENNIGTFDGNYTTKTEGDKNLVTISYTILFDTREETYEYSVTNDVLTLISIKNGSKTVFSRAAGQE